LTEYVPRILGLRLYSVKGHKSDPNVQTIIGFLRDKNDYGSTGVKGTVGGIVIGRWYVGHAVISAGGFNGPLYKFTILLPPSVFITSDYDAETVEQSEDMVNIAAICGPIGSDEYTMIESIVDGSSGPGKGFQRNAFDFIVETHEAAHKLTSYLISGAPGTGKTFLAYLLANHYKTTIVDSFTPAEPGATFMGMVKGVPHDPSAPLIVLIDEWDSVVNTIVGLDVSFDLNGWSRRLVGKAGVNGFLDRLKLRHGGKNIIVLFTYNPIISSEVRPRSFAADPAFRRNGRYTAFIDFDAKYTGLVRQDTPASLE